jgi:DNA (cytosine-5)-methyltransferase 1
MALRTISICAGVGALDLGVRIARPDARCVAFVEREASAAASLVASMEAGRLHPAAIWSDLRTFDARAWRGGVDCVLSGDPCQGNSVAGKRLGEADDRWLLDRAIEVYDESGADTFFRENVPGNLAGQLAVAIPALERLGCRIACGIFSAFEAGASHRRERFFILADRSHLRHERSRGTWRWRDRSSDRCGRLADTSSSRQRPRPLDKARRSSGTAFLGNTGGALANTDGRGSGDGYLQRGGEQRLFSQGRGIGEGRSRIRAGRPFAPGPADPIWGEIIRDAPALEPAVCRVAHGVAGRIERLRHCGNGVVPLTGALAWMRLHGLLADQAAGDAVRFADDRTARAGQLAMRNAA